MTTLILYFYGVCLHALLICNVLTRCASHSRHTPGYHNEYHMSVLYVCMYVHAYCTYVSNGAMTPLFLRSIAAAHTIITPE